MQNMEMKNEKRFWLSRKPANGHSPIVFSVQLGVRMFSDSEENRRRCGVAHSWSKAGEKPKP